MDQIWEFRKEKAGTNLRRKLLPIIPQNMKLYMEHLNKALKRKELGNCHLNGKLTVFQKQKKGSGWSESGLDMCFVWPWC